MNASIRSVLAIAVSMSTVAFAMEQKTIAENTAEKVFTISELQEAITEFTVEWELYRTVYSPRTEFSAAQEQWNVAFSFDHTKDVLAISYSCVNDTKRSQEVSYSFETCYNEIRYRVTGRPLCTVNIPTTIVSECGKYKLVQQEHNAFGNNRIDIYRKKQVDLKAVITPKREKPEERSVMSLLGWGAAITVIVGSLYKLWR